MSIVILEISLWGIDKVCITGWTWLSTTSLYFYPVIFSFRVTIDAAKFRTHFPFHCKSFFMLDSWEKRITSICLCRYPPNVHMSWCLEMCERWFLWLSVFCGSGNAVEDVWHKQQRQVPWKLVFCWKNSVYEACFNHNYWYWRI